MLNRGNDGDENSGNGVKWVYQRFGNGIESQHDLQLPNMVVNV